MTTGSEKIEAASDLPKWPHTDVYADRIVVHGKHGTPTSFYLTKFVLFGALLLYIGLWVLDFYTKSFHIMRVSGIIARATGIDSFIPKKPDIFVISLVIFFIPIVLAFPLATHSLRFHWLVHRFLRRRLRLEFTSEGVLVTAGAGASKKLYRYDRGGIAFRVIDHPLAKRTRVNYSLPEPYLETGRVQLLSGELRVKLADIAWKDRANDFVACLNWALRQMQPTVAPSFRPAAPVAGVRAAAAEVVQRLE